MKTRTTTGTQCASNGRSRTPAPWLVKHAGQQDELLSSCWEETVDAGRYDLADGAKLDWGKVLRNDRFFALLTRLGVHEI